MKELVRILDQVPEFSSLLTALDSGACPAAVSGLAAVHRAHFAAGLRAKAGRRVVVVCADEGEAQRFAEDLHAFTGEQVLTLPSREFTFHDAAVVSRQWEHRRLSALRALAMGETDLVVTTPEALLQRTLPSALLLQTVHTLRVGEVHDLTELAETLTAAGYVRCDQVEGVGQFALRGGILDLFSPACDQPIRCEFFGDEIDAMGTFDPATQRRVENRQICDILPVAEVLPQLSPGGFSGLAEALERLISQEKTAKGDHNPLIATLSQDRERLSQGLSFPAMDRYLSLVYPELATAADYLPEDAVVCLSESPRVAERARNYLWRMEEDVKTLLESGLVAGSLARFTRTFEELMDRLSDWPVVYLDTFTSNTYPLRPRSLLDVLTKQLPSYGASLETAAADLEHYQKAGFATVVLASAERRCLDLQAMLRERKVRTAVDFQLHELPGPGKAVICLGGLSAGFEYPGASAAVLTEGRAIPARKVRSKRDSSRQKLASYADLSPGDLVVHEHHGIGRYVGMVKMSTDGVQKDYVKIAYAGSDVLYVPATQLDLVSKYIGSGDDTEHKKLNKLGGTDWEKTKTRAKKAVQDLAKGLIQLYAQRERLPGHAFAPDSPWMREFEDQFEYTETDDQLRCIQDIKRDMETPKPMDRLLCGDVGYGKTEVAFRAIMKCVLDGKQAAILAPTTVLARQHYLSARRRFAKFPVEIDVVSRFRTPAQMRQTLMDLRAGKVDLLIGTHRLFNKDVQFKDLGLLVVDEEQRFGVQHKEKLKELSKQVDVLTLSATPIPRTLNMALSGIRDMSTLEEPPQDRQPVQTYVLEHSTPILDDAIRREVQRGGQVYYLHNQVETIDQCASAIQRRIPDITVGVAHGQMTEAALSDVMHAMADGDIQVLVCTTIIETGLDIPNANTLIIENADRFGLSQLHQLRGRVGRSTRHAYAYFTYRPDKSLTEIAEKRLSAIRDFAEFGSGFKIAMRDLEIRGSGNLLGAEQSGHMMSVGYDMYLKLLDEAILEEKGEKPREPECTADLNITANIDPTYVSQGEERMDLYRRMAAIRSQEDADDLLDEIVDRYGEPPKGVLNLVDVALLRAKAKAVHIRDIRQKAGEIQFVLTSMDFAALTRVSEQPEYKNRLQLVAAAKEPTMRLTLTKGVDSLRQCKAFVEKYAQALNC